MRKRIALFANGWGNEFLQEVGHGMSQVAEKADIDIFAFINYSAHGESEAIQLREMAIFKLPDLNDFDGAVVLAGSFNHQREIDYIEEVLKETKIPAISLEYKLDNADYLGTDDYSGMYQLTEHLITEHEVKDILYMGGIPNHKGNITRLKAVRDVIAKYGISLPEENILHGDFSADPAKARLSEWCEKHDSLPEAIICANDVMAVGICDWLKGRGYRVPEDVKVTGFDCVKKALEYDPQITSVNQEWVAMGKRCMEKLLQKIAGEEVSPYEEQKSRLICGESCGCRQDKRKAVSEFRRDLGAETYYDGFVCDQHFRHMYLALRKAQTEDELNYSLSMFFTESCWMEGDKTCICLQPGFFRDSDDIDKLCIESYPEEMAVVCSVYGKEKTPYHIGKTKDTIFATAKKNDRPGIYLFVPVLFDDILLGYVMLTKGFILSQNDVLYIWTRHMSEYLEQVRANATIKKLTTKLEYLSVMDSLTNVFNRNGCEEVIYPKVRECQENGGRSVIMMVDLDHLKYINDQYGHAGGDQAIATTAASLRKGLPEDFMIGRFGGDEFLVVGCMDKEADIEKLIGEMEENLQKEAKRNNLPFKMSMSIGGIQLEAGAAFDIVSSIQKADKRMYEMKEEHHFKNWM